MSLILLYSLFFSLFMPLFLTGMEQKHHTHSTFINSLTSYALPNDKQDTASFKNEDHQFSCDTKFYNLNSLLDLKQLHADYLKNFEQRKIETQEKAEAEKRALFNRVAQEKVAIQQAYQMRCKEEKIALEKAAAQKTAEEHAPTEKAAWEKAEELKRSANDSEKVLLMLAEQAHSKQQYTDCIRNWCQLSATSNNITLLKQAHQKLHALQDYDQTGAGSYHLAYLDREIPEKMIPHFILAEHKKDTFLKQKEQEKKGTAQKQPNQKKNLHNQNVTRIDVVSQEVLNGLLSILIEYAKKDNKHACYQQACHALATHFFYRASLYPAQQIDLLEKSLEYACQVSDAPLPQGACDHATILYRRGTALFDTIKSSLKVQPNGTKKSNLTNAKKLLSTAEQHLQEAKKLGNKDACVLLPYFLEKSFLYVPNRHTLSNFISGYIQLIEQNNVPAAQHVEMLLLNGIDGLSLGLPQRACLLDALKKQSFYESLLLKSTSYEHSLYKKQECAAIEALQIKNQQNIDEIKTHYLLLYHFDRGEHSHILTIIDTFLKQYQGILNQNIGALIISLLMAQPHQRRFESLKVSFYEKFDQWPLAHKLFIASSAAETLQLLVNQNNLEAIYYTITSIANNLLDEKYFSEATPTEKICTLLKKAESLLERKPYHPQKNILLDFNFIKHLADFASENNDYTIVYTFIDLTLKRLQQRPTAPLDNPNYVEAVFQGYLTGIQDMGTRLKKTKDNPELRRSIITTIDDILCRSTHIYKCLKDLRHALFSPDLQGISPTIPARLPLESLSPSSCNCL